MCEQFNWWLGYPLNKSRFRLDSSNEVQQINAARVITGLKSRGRARAANTQKLNKALGAF